MFSDHQSHAQRTLMGLKNAQWFVASERLSTAANGPARPLPGKKNRNYPCTNVYKRVQTSTNVYKRFYTVNIRLIAPWHSIFTWSSP